MFRIVFCCFSAIKSIAEPSSSSNFLSKLVSSGMLVFVCLGKSMPISLQEFFNSKVFCTLLACVLKADQKNGLLSINAVKSMIYTKESPTGLWLPFLNKRTNNQRLNQSDNSSYCFLFVLLLQIYICFNKFFF